MSKDTLVIISLRGGADALNIVVPYRDEAYYKNRPLLSIPRPGEQQRAAIDLDGFYGLHPALAPLLPLYQRKELAILHAVGWPGDSHSHFEAWDEIESGTLGENRANTGWLARYLQQRADKASSPLRGVAFGEILPKLLTGALGVSALRSLEDFRLTTKTTATRNALQMLYKVDNRLSAIGGETIAALDTVEKLMKTPRANQLAYPKTSFGMQLHAIEQLIRADVGLEAASAELIGWDTHIMQGATDGHMAGLLQELATGLAAFTTNLSDRMENILIVALSEFGRRVGENGSGGTDHGQAGMMLFCGGSVQGGHVYGKWPGLAADKLAGPGDLAITTDFRDALGEVVEAKLGTSASAKIFPGYQRKARLGIVS